MESGQACPTMDNPQNNQLPYYVLHPATLQALASEFSAASFPT